MVKRVGNLISRIADRDNLREAFLRAARGKSSRQEVVEFRNHLDDNIERIHEQLLNGTYQFGDYHFFTIYDPKKRTICAAPFQHRVVFHAIMRICHPVFDNYQIYDSYASRIGKGTYKALERAQTFSKRYRCFAKMDVCKYFDSIDHQVLLKQLCRLFKDRLLLSFFQDLLSGYEVTKGRGLPIGNLTSQYFANHYLAVADHYAKEQLHIPAIVRYMDDVLFFSDDVTTLKNYVEQYVEFCNQQLLLEMHPPIINKVYHGIPFLGYVVYENQLRLNGRSRKRFAKNIASLDMLYWIGDEQTSVPQRASCLFAFIDKANSEKYRKKLYEDGTYS